jgi:hypothetical protein
MDEKDKVKDEDKAGDKDSAGKEGGDSIPPPFNWNKHPKHWNPYRSIRKVRR